MCALLSARYYSYLHLVEDELSKGEVGSLGWSCTANRYPRQADLKGIEALPPLTPPPREKAGTNVQETIRWVGWSTGLVLGSRAILEDTG